jgi:large repetitive protein
VPTMASLTLNVTGFDTVTTVLGSTCGGTPVRCSDPPSTTFTNFAGGIYYVSIEGFSGTTTGAFTLTTTGTVAPGESCEGPLFLDGAFTCTTGYACSGPVGSATCVVAQCNDGMDNNGDGKIDFPNDPGCTSRNDNSEDTVCPGVMCPECGDGMDNDGDGQTDYPGDTTCTSASGGSEACAGETDPIVPITMPTISDTLVGASDGHNPTCGLDGGPDKMYTLRVPALATLTLDTEGSMITDTLLSFMTGACTEPSIECDDDDGTGNLSLIQRTNVAAGTYIIAVDAYSTSVTPAPFKLNVSGTVAPNASCEGPLFTNGVLTCTTGYACNGVMGSRTCSRQCSDGVDNNGDGKIDFPNDPGCTSATDTTEDTLCPGAMCPACGDGMDNDSDGQTDYPADIACSSASGASENFCSVDPDFRGDITMPVTMGTLAAPAGDHRDQTCQAPANTGNDVAYALTSPVPASWVITTEGSTIFDTLLSVHDATCTVTQYACDDDSGTGRLSRITVALPAGAYAIQVDSYSQTGNNGPFQLNVQGTVAAGTDCTSPLFASGVLVCAAGQACTAGTCQ